MTGPFCYKVPWWAHLGFGSQSAAEIFLWNEAWKTRAHINPFSIKQKPLEDGK